MRSVKKQPFDVTLSFPFADITEKLVTLTRVGNARTLENEKDVMRWPDDPSYIYAKGVQDGDTITVGAVAKDAQPLRLLVDVLDAQAASVEADSLRARALADHAISLAARDFAEGKIFTTTAATPFLRIDPVGRASSTASLAP